MRRKQNSLIPLEKLILTHAEISGEFCGYEFEKLKVKSGAIYRALNRLVQMGYLTERWDKKRHLYSLKNPNKVDG